MSRATLIDSPFANLDSIGRALREAGAELTVSRDHAGVALARRIVLPGVGAFAPAMDWLNSSGIAGALAEAVSAGASILGICLGHQLLFDWSEELGRSEGLGLIAGSVVRLGGGVRVPKIGWNRVDFEAGEALFDGIAPGESFYFVHSYRAVCENPSAETATADYGERFTVAVRHGNVRGVQFHPEKSSSSGLRLLRNWLELPPEGC